MERFLRVLFHRAYAGLRLGIQFFFTRSYSVKGFNKEQCGTCKIQNVENFWWYKARFPALLQGDHVFAPE